MSAARPRGEWAVLLACLAGGLLFFASLGRLWPLAPLDLVAPRDGLEAQARAGLAGNGFDLGGFDASTRLAVDSRALDYVERAFGLAEAQRWIARGLPLFEYRVLLKRRGSPTRWYVMLHPDAGITGWYRSMEDDEAGPRLAADAARELARAELNGLLGGAAREFDERSWSSVEQPERRDHRFGFERELSKEPELRERVNVTVAGDRVVSALRSVVVPAAARRASVAAEAPGRAMELIGFVLLALAGLGAFFVFLRGLRDRRVELGRAMVWPLVVFACLIGTFALERPALFRYWEPLWPKWVSDFQYLVSRGGGLVWLVLALLAVVAAGDALDREGGGRRGASLWSLARGRITDPGVVQASWRGFMIGLLCGGAMAAVVWLLQLTAGATTAIQPRGFFFYTLNTSAPAATSLLFFFGVAMAEELGYRFFLGGWLLSLLRRRWIAVVVPGLIYGLTHTRLDFLPTAEPFWSRAVILTVVGCVWGWAFLRYDALTVVLSHFTADLFIFNWPRLASGDDATVGLSLATVAIPLLPALVGGLTALVRMRRRRGHRSPSA